ncbi:MAG: hypothetical protein HRT44_06475 [Bdellovibrionales bacterium]|nr:hypothetical protein [Bdellovibrionales bacterium]NQZ18886.1 hypothetical protein [Bdellovibrionales bacterium]
MKLNKLVIPLSTLSLMSVSCSKIDHAMTTADDIKASTQRLESDSSNSLRKQKESGALAAMGLAIEKLIQAETSTGRLAHATRYFAAMPYQFIYKDDARTQYYYKISLGDFLSERFAELSEGRQESYENRVSAANGIMVSEKFWGDAEHQDITADYNPNHFPELAALAVRMHYITEDQKDLTDEPKSFMDLLEELLEASYEIQTCTDCSLDDYPDYIQSNLQFSGQLIEFMQFAHNTLTIAGLKGVIRDATQDEKNAQRSYVFWEWTNLPGDNPPAITHASLIKEDTNAQDLKLSIERFERAQKIRHMLKQIGVEPVYSKYVYEEKFGKYLEQPEGNMDRSSLSSSAVRDAFDEFFSHVHAEYNNYKQSQE